MLPYRAPHLLETASLSAGLDVPGVLATFRRRPASEPRSEAGRPRPTSVPRSGFLNLSAVSWQRRVLRPCFVPLPPVGASFRVFPSQGSWITSRRHQLPGRSPPACLKRAARRPARRFTDRHAEGAPAWIPVGFELPFRVHPKAGASRSLGPHATEPFPFRQLRRLRSLAPPASPFRPPRVFHRDRRP